MIIIFMLISSTHLYISKSPEVTKSSAKRVES